MTTRTSLPRATLAATLLAGTSPVCFATDDPPTAELLTRIEQQAAKIDELTARLAQLEKSMAANGAPRSDSGMTAAVASSPSAPARKASQDLAGNVRWKRSDAAPTFASDDGQHTFKPHGRLLMDFSRTHGSSHATRNLHGSEVANLRLGGEGAIGALGYRIEAEFANDSVALQPAYLSYNTTVAGNEATFYLGNFLKDLGTEGSSDLARVPFLLRNAAVAVARPFVSYFGMGTQVRVYGDRWHYTLSITGNAPKTGTSGKYSETVTYLTRAHINPWKTKNGFVHVGGWYYYESLGGGVSSIDTTMPLTAFNKLLMVSAGPVVDPTRDRGTGLELGGVHRSTWAIAEHGKRTIHTRHNGRVHRQGTSVAAGWMITGEAPGFSSRSGSWKAVKVANPVSSGGTGAFEVAGRIDHYDFTDAPGGGTGRSATMALNWYLNDWSRLMFNYIRWETNNRIGTMAGRDDGHSLALRAEVLL
ncbi:porin [Luteibacter flocculans]|uniref:Porin n=1 Tax=Luteibacter flocculans TaxID=2780091 RepID=A0ABY4SWZ9_9GAMM|nr:porin [Luteibacter flocculans]URL57242.1 porin [Luteibacter flocculans]